MLTQIEAAKDLSMLNEQVIPPLFTATLQDYQSNIPEAREAEVLHLLCVIVMRFGVSGPSPFDVLKLPSLRKLQGLISYQMPPVFDAVFGCTLEMITKDFVEFPEHRTHFFSFLRAVNKDCFPGKHSTFERDVLAVIDFAISSLSS